MYMYLYVCVYLQMMIIGLVIQRHSYRCTDTNYSACIHTYSCVLRVESAYYRRPTCKQQDISLSSHSFLCTYDSTERVLSSGGAVEVLFNCVIKQFCEIFMQIMLTCWHTQVWPKSSVRETAAILELSQQFDDHVQTARRRVRAGEFAQMSLQTNNLTCGLLDALKGLLPRSNNNNNQTL